MIQQLSEISRSIPLTHCHSVDWFNTIKYHCPQQLLVLNQSQLYQIEARLCSKKQKTMNQGVFDSFYLTYTQKGPHNGYRFTHQIKQLQITPTNLHNFISKGNHNQQLQQKKQGFGLNVEFDKKILKLLMALRYDDCFKVDLANKKLFVYSQNIDWQFSINCQSKTIAQSNQFTISSKQILSLIKTQQYLQRIQRFLNQQKTSQQKGRENIMQNQINSKEQKIERLKQKQNNVLKERVNQLQTQLMKNTQTINELIRDIQGIEMQLNTYGQKIQIQQNKFTNIIDQFHEIVKQNKLKLGDGKHELHIKDKKQPDVTVPDFIRQKLSIDLHSSYLGKFQVKGSHIIYIGQDKQATQLLSNKIFGIQHHKTHLKSTLHVVKTKAKCIKFGIIDSTYVKQRSCWNFSNIIYLHGWGHTMVAGHEQDHDHSDYGTGNRIEMEVDFQNGWIRWMIDGKRGVKLHNQPARKLIKSNDIDWTPFIAMYNQNDCIEWQIKQQE